MWPGHRRHGDRACRPRRPYVDELGADPGRLRIGILDHHPQGGPVDPEVTDAAQSVGELLESLGHHVEPAWPKALEDNTFGATFGALWSTNMGVSRRRFEEQLGRPLQDDEFEPMNRVQADFAAHFTSVDYALALSAVAQYPAGDAVVVARRLGSAADADACRGADQARHDRQRRRYTR